MIIIIGEGVAVWGEVGEDLGRCLIVGNDRTGESVSDVATIVATSDWTTPGGHIVAVPQRSEDSVEILNPTLVPSTFQPSQGVSLLTQDEYRKHVWPKV